DDLVTGVQTCALPISEGRFELGLGAGWIARESQMTGIPFDPAGQRVGRLEEAVQLLKGLFSDGPMTFAGRYYSMNGFEVFPKPRSEERSCRKRDYIQI